MPRPCLGGLRRPRPVVPDHRPVHQRRARLAGGRVQDQGSPTAGRHPAAAGHAALEARGLAQVPVLPEGPLSFERVSWDGHRPVRAKHIIPNAGNSPISSRGERRGKVQKSL